MLVEVLTIGQIVTILGAIAAGIREWIRLKDRMSAVEQKLHYLEASYTRMDHRLWNGEGLAVRVARVEQSLQRLKGRQDRDTSG